MTTNRTPRRRGFTLIEVMTVCIIMGVLASMSVPRFSRAMEQSRANIAVANLRAIWTAQRIYWLQHNNTYANDLATLRAAQLLDASIIDQPTFDSLDSEAQKKVSYLYSSTLTATVPLTFQATAVRVNATAWSSSLAIDANGYVTGSVQYVGSSTSYKSDGPIDQFFQ